MTTGPLVSRIPIPLHISISLTLSSTHSDTLELSLSSSPTIAYTEGLFTDYQYFDQHNIAPRFEFGFGLSYSFTASYSSLSIVSTGTNAYTVTVSVKNTGSRAGTEIAQLYVGYPSGAGEPPKVLRGFEAIPLAAGQTQTASFPLAVKDIRYSAWANGIGPLRIDMCRSVWDSPSGAFVRPSGTFTIYVGSSSRNIALSTTF